MTLARRNDALFKYLFNINFGDSLAHLSDGLNAIVRNADRLLADAELLANAGRYSRADFLAATVQEELGKAYIILDMCRVDLARHQGVLRRLCNRFYSHVDKHVYFELAVPIGFRFGALSEIRDAYRVHAQKWWPAESDSGEPDLPNDTFLMREFNLYVDVDHYAHTWMVPDNDLKRTSFDLDGIWDIAAFSNFEIARRAFADIELAHNAGLFRAEALRLFNESMKRMHISEKTSVHKLLDAYDRVANIMEAERGISQGRFRESVLCNCPLYWIENK